MGWGTEFKGKVLRVFFKGYVSRVYKKEFEEKAEYNDSMIQIWRDELMVLCGQMNPEAETSEIRERLDDILVCYEEAVAENALIKNALMYSDPEEIISDS